MPNCLWYWCGSLASCRASNLGMTCHPDPKMCQCATNGCWPIWHDIVCVWQGACTTLISVRIYYIACPSIIVNYAVFPDTPAGPDMTSIVQQDGVCLSHATVEQPPSYLCKADGNWYYATGRCQCTPGYQPDAASSQCVGRCWVPSSYVSVMIAFWTTWPTKCGAERNIWY